MARTIRVAGLILAGGRGERLGGTIKSELVVGGLRLLERVALPLADCSPLLVAHGRLDPAQLRLPAHFRPVPDLPGDYAGPLAGLAAAVAPLALLAEPPELLVCAAVDAPFLPTGYVDWLIAGLGPHDAAIAGYSGQPYPTNSIWRLARIAQLPAEVLAGTAPRSLKSLAARLDSVLQDWPRTAAGDPFANINTPEELAEMQRRAGTSGGVRED